jgi:hypothetical protein
MALLHRLLLRAARRAATDPRVQARAADIYQNQVKPRARAAWQETKPRLAAAKRDLKAIARETDPRDDPKGFAVKLKQRFVDGDRDV